MGTSPLRILVVDDYDPFRRFVCSTLEERLDCQVIREASDGLEAVQKARKLQPHLIVLDIGLPTLNGIEAARRIRKLSPKSKILVVSQESSADVVQEVFNLGASGYALKSQAGSELLAAVEAVMQGKRFVSSALADHVPTDIVDDQASSHFHQTDVLPPVGLPMTQESDISRCHVVQFYPDDESFVEGFSRFLTAALKAERAVIVVATESHRKSLLQRVQEHGVDCAGAMEEGRYIVLDAAETLATFMINDLPDPVLFFAVVGNLIAGAARATKSDQSRVTVCGECASILWEQGKTDAAIQVEQLCNQLSKRYEVDILCGFSLRNFYREEDKEVFQRICSE